MSKENKENKKENKTEKKNKDEKESKQKIKMENIITKDIIPRGLNNIGSTCYMNSVIQCLYHIFDLSNELLLLYKSKILNQSLLKKLPMTYAFLDVIYDLSFDKKSSISPYKFKKIIGNNKSFRNFEANDSKNLTLYILDMLNRELNENKIISENELYTNKIRNYKEEDAKSMVNYFNENQNSLIGDLFNGLKSTNYINLLPFERLKGKIILLGSMMGNLNFLTNEKLKNEFKQAKTYQELFNLTEAFKASFKNKTTDKDGWCINTYSVSKMIVNTYARVLSLINEIESNDISVYGAHPG